jgi:hypothetical protein
LFRLDFFAFFLPLFFLETKPAEALLDEVEIFVMEAAVGFWSSSAELELLSEELPDEQLPLDELEEPSLLPSPRRFPRGSMVRFRGTLAP